MSDSWIEPKSRIPFTGIIAIVVIVAVVAIFVKTQLSPLFPASTVTVQSGEAVQGKASSSFYGEREIALSSKEYLRGTLNTPQQSTTFIVDYSGLLLTVVENNKREEVLLKQFGNTLSATFDYHGAQVRVDVDAAHRSLTWTTLDKGLPVSVALANFAVEQGYFNYRNKQYLFQFSPAGSVAYIIGEGTDTVQLVENRLTFRGSWFLNDEHAVTVTPASHIATIENVY